MEPDVVYTSSVIIGMWSIDDKVEVGEGKRLDNILLPPLPIVVVLVDVVLFSLLHALLGCIAKRLGFWVVGADIF